MDRHEARTRNWTILRLRGLYSHARCLTGERCEIVRKAVEDELKAMGVETHEERHTRWQLEALAGIKRSN